MVGSPAVAWEHQLPGGHQARVLVRPAAFNLLIDGEQPSYTFDALGRLHGAFEAGHNFRRGLDNRVLAKWSLRTDAGRVRRRRWLAEDEARALIGRAYGWARQVEAGSAGAPEEVLTALAALGRWDWARLQEDKRRFQEIYTPIGILPPDQYLALVLQATHGCSHNACTFCSFYRDIPFRIKSPEEFRAHVTAVLGFFGPAIAMRRSIFLADANALVVPMPRLLALLDVLEEVGGPEEQRVRGQSVGGEPASFPLPLFAFVDAFHGHRKSLADWEELAARGLQRVYIGMESGHDPLLRWLNKPGQAAVVLEAVMLLKAAGVQVSVVLMLGVGGNRFADGHVEDTVRLLNAMPLGAGDLIYFSDFVAQPDAPYAELAAAAGVHPLDAGTRRRQEAAIRSGFLPRDAGSRPQFSRYDIREFIY